MHKSEEITIIENSRNGVMSTFNNLIEYKDLFYFLFRRDFLANYKQSVLGTVWFFVQPISMCLVYYFLFSKVAKIDTLAAPPLLFYLSGVVFWSFFSNSINVTSNTFVVNAHLFKKVFFPRIIAPLSGLATVYFKALIQVAMILLAVIYYKYMLDVDSILNIFKIVLGFTLLGLISVGFGLYVASASVRYHDLRFVSSYFVQLLMYVTTIVYPYQGLPEMYKKLMFFNPITHIVEFMRSGIVSKYFYDEIGFYYSVLFSLCLFYIGIRKFNYVEKNFVDQV